MPGRPEGQEVTLGWSDRVEQIKQRMADKDKPTYTDQDGNDVPLCIVCMYYRATHGAYCELCSAVLGEDVVGRYKGEHPSYGSRYAADRREHEGQHRHVRDERDFIEPALGGSHPPDDQRRDEHHRVDNDGGDRDR